MWFAFIAIAVCLPAKFWPSNNSLLSGLMFQQLSDETLIFSVVNHEAVGICSCSSSESYYSSSESSYSSLSISSATSPSESD